MIELQEASLAAVKVHLLGRDQTGAPTEPEACWSSNNMIMFKRYFHEQLSPWTENNLKIEYQECRKNSRNVARKLVVAKDKYNDEKTEYQDLCPFCFESLQSAFDKQIKETEAKRPQEHSKSGL